MYVRKPVHFHSLFDHAGDLVLVFLLSTGRSSESSYPLEPLKLVTVYNLGSTSVLDTYLVKVSVEYSSSKLGLSSMNVQS
jgi:hypothetical protein